jgi:predicted unusual protein kinase regulating ubiquinone biosynthesis (AarF/ABC1/UbiB family)
VIPRAYWRFVLVTRRFLPLALAYLRDRRRWVLFGGRRDVGAETQRRRAEHLLDAILALGPTFIKLGQLLSTRPDLLPRVYVDVLSRLQDQVPPADWADARTVLDDAVGGADAYDAFDTEPISGASLGQVYLAELDGRRVAVKVRRPGVESLVEADLRVIRWLLPIVKRFVGESRSFSLANLADEFDQVIHEEMDYEREARMLTEIRDNFADNDRVRIPATVESHSTASVLTMEYVEGTKVTEVDELDAMGVDRHAVAETLQRAYLRMIVDDGVFHADPHPGNIAVQRDGTVVFYDFGMSGRVSGYIQDRIVDFYIAVADRNIDGILDALTAMGTLAPDADRETMGAVMELAIADARGEDIEDYRVRGIVERIENTIYEFPFRLPANLALVLRVATVVEGVCVTLDPDYDFISVATAYLTEQGYREEGARRVAESAARTLGEAAASTVRVPTKLEGVLDDLDREQLTINAAVRDPDGVFDRLAARLIYGLLAAVGALSTALLFSVGSPLPATVAAVLTLPVLYLLRRSFRDRSGIAAQPQFTRQNLRKRDEESAAADGDEIDLLTET